MFTPLFPTGRLHTLIESTRRDQTLRSDTDLFFSFGFKSMFTSMITNSFSRSPHVAQGCLAALTSYQRGLNVSLTNCSSFHHHQIRYRMNTGKKNWRKEKKYLFPKDGFSLFQWVIAQIVAFLHSRVKDNLSGPGIGSDLFLRCQHLLAYLRSQAVSFSQPTVSEVQ